MKISYELEPQEFEAMCTCITSLFQIYADTENKNEMTAQLLNRVADKVDKMEQEQRRAYTAPKIKSVAPVAEVKAVPAVKKKAGRPKKAAPVKAVKAVDENNFNEV